MSGKKKDEHGKAKEARHPAVPRLSATPAEEPPGLTSVQVSPGQETDDDLSALYRATAGQLYRFALLLTKDPGLAQDAVHETFLKYHVQRTRGHVPEERAWLFRVLRNFVIDQQKSASSKKSVTLEEAHGFEDRTQSPYRAFENSEAMQLVFEVLSPREFQCLQLRAEGFSYREIANILAIGPGTVGALLARASEKIRKAFAEEGLPCEAI